MKRFVIASALAVVGALGFSNTADAQYVYGYQAAVPGTGIVVRNQTFATPFGIQNTQGFYSPYTGLWARQWVSADVGGNQSAGVSGSTRYTNLGSRRGYSAMRYTFYGLSVTRYGYIYRR